MARPFTIVEIALAFGIGGTVLAAAVPAFFRDLQASKLSEPVNGLRTILANAVAYADGRPQDISFPPSAPQTPAEVPRGIQVTEPENAWEHLTWKSLRFRIDGPHAFAFRYDSTFDPATQIMRFTATAHGDLDGDGTVSTFEVGGERLPGQPAHATPGMFVDREVE